MSAVTVDNREAHSLSLNQAWINELTSSGRALNVVTLPKSEAARPQPQLATSSRREDGTLGSRTCTLVAIHATLDRTPGTADGVDLQY